MSSTGSLWRRIYEHVTQLTQSMSHDACSLFNKINSWKKGIVPVQVTLHLKEMDQVKINPGPHYEFWFFNVLLTHSSTQHLCRP